MDVGFQTNSAEGAPIDVGAEITGLIDGVRGSAGAEFSILKITGNGVSGIGGGFTSPGGSGVYGQGTYGPGVTGQGADASAGFSETSSQGVVGLGSAASVAVVSVGGGSPEVQSEPGGPGVVGTGGAGDSTEEGSVLQLAPPGPGVVGTGGAAVNGQQSGTGVVGVAGGVPLTRRKPGLRRRIRVLSAGTGTAGTRAWCRRSGRSLAADWASRRPVCALVVGCAGPSSGFAASLCREQLAARRGQPGDGLRST